MSNKKVKKILESLELMYPDAHCELEYNTPFELLVATILSAQSTDKQVNKVTSKLFSKYNTPQAILEIGEEGLTSYIKSIGLYRNKSKNIIKTCKDLIDKWDGQVPCDREALELLPGVGRKTASVVLSNAFNIPALAVDTHVQRVANRLGIVKTKNPLETEKGLIKKIPKKEWAVTHHRIIWHGRRICYARNPICSHCDLLEVCTYGKKKV